MNEFLWRVRAALDARRQGRRGRAYHQEYAVSREAADFGTDDFSTLFKEHRGRLADKWVHYLPLYDRHFGPLRGKAFKFLEIGVSKGGSLELWRKYFGDKATIFGIDIDPECASRFDLPNMVRIGSQADPAFLRSVVDEMGGLDLVLDDGSHAAPHQQASFETLFPLLSDGGLYAIEDLHTAYWWGEWVGGYRRKGTAIEMVKAMIDDLHGWWHDKPEAVVRKEDIGGIHIYDSIVFIEKVSRKQPQVVRVGG